ncbi:Retrovirus-related Pol polyprotein from type-1 retrotransposable element R1 [Araneus ventricosus]|uniref:Retrovirus-related Pol polyprotein from type-1 retrotransposable element R1 n=2 Tax=Araneus ventricosus TaxID=182803 RepID=A0A4Y2D5G8_ARAVE|nr:Retrovirus-related Pol polyprotein from type-1 retrotransposable element R1 [Araneus ventricosus]
MATTEGSEYTALMDLPKVVVDKPIGGRLSLKKQNKKDMTENMVDHCLTGDFGVRKAKSKMKRDPAVVQSPKSTWHFRTYPEDKALTDHGSGLPPVSVDSDLNMDIPGPVEVSRPSTSKEGLFSKDSEESLPTGDTSEDSDSHTYYDTTGTPRVPGPCNHLYYLNDKLLPPPTFEGGKDDFKMDEDAPLGQRKRPAGKPSKASKKKMPKKPLVLVVDVPTKRMPKKQLALASKTEPSVRKGPKLGALAVHPDFYGRVPDFYAPDSPVIPIRTGSNFHGVVPETPSPLLGRPSSFDVKKELLKIVAEYTVPAELVDRLTDFMSVVEKLLSGRDKFMHNIDSRLRALESSMTKDGSSPFATALRCSQFVPGTPVQLGVPRIDGPATSVPDPSVNGPWQTVGKKGKTPVTNLKVIQESAPPPPAASRPTKQVPIPPPRPDVPAIVVKPVGATITASATLKGLLEAKVSPQALGVRVLRCQPANGHGVLVRVETSDMADKLVQAINSHPELQACCEARVPRKRSPQILIYDIPDMPGDRAMAEEEFLDKLRVSNSLPDGDIRVLFRRKGRGSQHHWVLSVAPSIFASFGQSRRLHWGFGSFRFREYCEALRCFKCYKYGHIRTQCSAPQELCSKCPGAHNFKDCTKDSPICRNCRDFNARNRNAPRLPVQHSAISEKCPGNLGRSQVGTQELPHLDLPFRPDVYLVQEPYLVNNSIYGLPLNWRTVVATSGKVLVTVRNPSIAMWILKACLVQELEAVVALCPPQQLFLAGDANARSLLWGPDIPDHRSVDDSGPFVDFVLAHRLAVWNDPLSGPTFETDRARGWIDVTLSSPMLHRRKGHWEVHSTLLSDHHPLLFILTGSDSVPSTLHSPLNRRQISQVAMQVSAFYETASLELDKISTKLQLEVWVQKLMIFLNQIHSFSGHAVQTRLRVPWWDTDLDIQRKKARTLRARFQRCKHPVERLLRRTIYKREVARYKYLIKTKSRACFESFCAKLTRLNPFQLPYKLAAHKIRLKPVLQGVRDSLGCMTSSVEATVRVIVSKLFPSDHAVTDTPVQKAVRQMVLDYSGDDSASPFSLQELKGVIHTLAKKKAPGLDGVTNELLRTIFARCPFLLLDLYNKCLQLSCFPDCWKEAKLVLLSKPGKDQSLASSYRPICLLSGMSKVLEKLVTQRLTFLFQSQGLLHGHQHGFRVGRSCETANHALWLEVQSAMRKGGKVAVISLDVAGAFDTVWRQSVLQRLTVAQCPHNLFRLISDYFDKRTVCYSFDSTTWSFPADRGVPQGSCSGPFYWNLVLDTVFQVDMPAGCYLQAFADDLILVVRGRTKGEIESAAQIALDRLIAWADGHKLQFNCTKTTLLPVTFGGRLSLADPPRVYMMGHEVQVVSSFRYLGVWWDSSLTFAVHFRKVRSRVDLLSYRISMVAERFYSRRGRLFLRLYKGALEPFVLYGHGAWGHRLRLQSIRTSLNSIQRKPLLRITKAFRTVSTVALQVLAGVMPLDLKAKGVFAKFLVSVARVDVRIGPVTLRSDDYSRRFNHIEVHPLLWHSIPFSRQEPMGFDFELFTDGSKDADRVGSSLVVFYHGAEIHHEECRLSDHASVFQAESQGLRMALMYVDTLSSWDSIRIYSDSLSLLQALASPTPGDAQVWNLKTLCKVARDSRNITLHWVKAHVGTLGNEKADFYAKRAVHRPEVDVPVLRSLSLLRHQITQVLLTQ